MLLWWFSNNPLFYVLKSSQIMLEWAIWAQLDLTNRLLLMCISGQGCLLMNLPSLILIDSLFIPLLSWASQSKLWSSLSFPINRMPLKGMYPILFISLSLLHGTQRDPEPGLVHFGCAGLVHSQADTGLSLYTFHLELSCFKMGSSYDIKDLTSIMFFLLYNVNNIFKK